MANRNLWAMGEELAKNPSMWSRVKHSSKGTSMRRMGKASSIPKALAKGGAMALKQIPVPVLRDVLSAAVDKAYDMAKHYHRKKYQIASAAGNEKKTKFGWKDLDVQDMDRYRWKVSDAVKSLNATTSKFNVKFNGYANEGKICEAYVRVTKDYAYACKRSKKLRTKAFAIKELCEQTLAWLDEVDGSLDKWVVNNKIDLTQKVIALGSEAHENCESTVCALQSDVKLRLKHPSAVNGVSNFAALVSGALDPNEFIVMGQPSDHKLKVNNVYSGSSHS
ncbi:hypothetical protein A9Q89_04445 [Gammaproteobacteria bacterium 53_120_T64]|nr:hypothetical protein A9Q89_04445 [Gammaproteobacteria bacterium 53_120_T64]